METTWRKPFENQQVANASGISINFVLGAQGIWHIQGIAIPIDQQWKIMDKNQSFLNFVRQKNAKTPVARLKYPTLQLKSFNQNE